MIADSAVVVLCLTAIFYSNFAGLDAVVLRNPTHGGIMDRTLFDDLKDQAEYQKIDPGEYFGEIGFLQDRPRSATVRVVDDDVEVLAFKKDVFPKLLGDSAETESTIAREMALRLARQARLQND